MRRRELDPEELLLAAQVKGGLMYFAKRHRCSLRTIYNRLRELNAPIGKRGNLSMERHPNWNGGRSDHAGYVMVNVGNARVFEHRLVMEQHLGRTLLDTEVVHHKNGIRDDNRIENLELYASASEHQLHHQREKRETVIQKERD